MPLSNQPLSSFRYHKKRPQLQPVTQGRAQQLVIEGLKSHLLGIRDSRIELCWELNSGLLALEANTLSAEPPTQPQLFLSFCFVILSSDFPVNLSLQMISTL